LNVDTVPPTEAEIVLLKSFLDDTSTAYRAMIEMDFDRSLIENVHVASLIGYCIGKYEDHGENMSPAQIIEVYREDEAIVSLITDTLTDTYKLSDEWEIPVDDPVVKTTMQARHAASLIMTQALTKKQSELQDELREVHEEVRQREIMTMILDHAQKINELKGV
jgi:hypothetical protein